jgi:hypothetical protein
MGIASKLASNLRSDTLREIRPIAVGRHNWTFAGSDEGVRRAAAIYTLIHSARINDVDPHAWLADVLARCKTIPPSGLRNSCRGIGKRDRLQKAAA